MESSNTNENLRKMRNLEWYDCTDPFLVSQRESAALLYRAFNQTVESPAGFEERAKIYPRLLGQSSEGVYLTPPFYCDYGSFIYLEKNVYMNFGCVVLDGADVRIGENSMLGPNCQIYTVFHPMDHVERNKGMQRHKPVIIGKNVWLGGGVIVLAGVTVGDNSVIGAGSVVTKDVEAGVFACGNPCKVVRKSENGEQVRS